MFRKFKKGFISLFFALAVMLSCCVLPVFATITEKRFDYYTTYTYTDEPILPRSYALGRGGDVLYETYNAMNYGSFTTADPIRITTIGRDSTTGKISSIKMEFTNIDYWYIYVHGDGNFHINVHDTKESDYTTFYSAEVYSIDDTKTRFAKFDWDNVLVTCPDIKKGDTFTYYDLQKNQHTIVFNGNGGIVGYGENDNPLDDLYEQEYPDFNLPEFENANLNDFVNFEDIISSIQGLDLIGAVTGILNALKGGFSYITFSVVNVVSYLTRTLTALFDWLKSTLPVLFNNFLVSLSPFFEMLRVAITSNPVGEFLLDQDGLFGKLDDILTGTKSIKEVFNESFVNALLIIPNFKNSVDSFLKIMEETLKGLWDDTTNFFKTFNNTTNTIFLGLPKQIESLPENIKESFKAFFISDSENYSAYISKKHENFMTLFYTKFPILEMPTKIKTAVESIQKGNTAIFTFSDVTFPLFNGKEFTIKGFTVEVDIVKKIRTFTDPIILGIAYLSTINFCKNEIPNLIGGVGAGVHQAGDSISQSIYNEQQKNRTKIGF